MLSTSGMGLRNCARPQPRFCSTPIFLAPVAAQRIQLRGARCQAAASENPYEVLGLKSDADGTAVTKAYNLMRSRYRGNLPMSQKIEAAHGQLMMAAFNNRLKGNVKVSNDIKYADKEVLFPWRPKRWDATPKMILIFGVIQLALTAFAFNAPSVSKSMGCMLLGIAGNFMKQNAIYPPPNDPDQATDDERGTSGRNFVRAAILGLMATAMGILLFSAPEYISQIFNIPIPVQPGLIVSLKVAGAAVANWIITSYYY